MSKTGKDETNASDDSSSDRGKSPAKPRQNIQIPIDVFQAMRDALLESSRATSVASVLCAEHCQDADLTAQVVATGKKIDEATEKVAAWQDQRLLGIDGTQTTLYG